MKVFSPAFTPINDRQKPDPVIIIFFILMVVHTKKQFQGQVFLWFLILHSTSRLLIERFRGDDRGFIPGSDMSITQLITLLILIASVILIFVMKYLTDHTNYV